MIDALPGTGFRSGGEDSGRSAEAIRLRDGAVVDR